MIGNIRFRLVFNPSEEEIFIRVRGLNYRIYSRILNAIEAYGKPNLAKALHEGPKPFTFSRLMPLRKETRLDKKKRLVFIANEPYLRFNEPFIMYFSAMVPEITSSFIGGITEIEPPFKAEILKIEPLYVQPFSRAKLKTLSPIYVLNKDPAEKEFRDLVVDELKTRIKIFRNVTPKEKPTFKPIVNLAKGQRPKKEVVFLIDTPEKKSIVDARSMSLFFNGPEIYLRAALLGGLGLKTHMGLGYVHLIK